VIATDNCITGATAISNAAQSLPVRFGENPCINPGVITERSFLKANVQDLA
jgi:hypothetical protein